VSRAVALLELGLELARRHKLNPTGRINLIPVLVDDLGSAAPILEALTTVTEGRLLISTEPELQRPVPATQNEFRRAAIEQALTQGIVGGKHVDFTYLGDGRVDATLPNTSPGGLSHGEQTVLAVARAFAHADLDNHTLAVVAYRGDLVDLPFSQGIWRLAIDHLNQLNHPTLKTLVLVIQVPEVSIEQHCQAGRGFAYGLFGDRILKRKASGDLQAAAGELGAHEQPWVLFLGAGFSASSRLPTGNAMRDDAIRLVLNIPASEVQTPARLSELFREFLADHGWLSAPEAALDEVQFARQLTLERVIQIESNTHPALPTLQQFAILHEQVVNAPGAALLHLSGILQHAAGRVVLVTVNFDRLIEANSGVELRVFASDEDFADAPAYIARYLAGDEVRTPLLKIHGTIANFATCIVNTDQTQLGLGANKLATLRTLLTNQGRLWVYVGASLRDLDLRPVLLSEDFSRGLDERWVMPFAVDSLDDFDTQRRPFWRSSLRQHIQDRLITETADAFLGALAGAWH
jgi:hypothetical protein